MNNNYTAHQIRNGIGSNNDRYVNIIDIERILNQTDKLEGEGFTDDVWNTYTFLRNELQKAIKTKTQENE
jgi:hypothetical protein